MELRDIEIFLTLAEELHFGRTAERLHVSQARVSRAISQQERRIGAPLFHRTSRRVRLTPLGEQLRRDLGAGYQQIMAGIAAATADARAHRGHLTLGTMGPQPWAIGEVIDLFQARHPTVRLRFREIQPTAPLDPVRSGEVDVGLVWLPVREPGLTVGPVTHTSAVLLMVHAAHPLAGRESVCLEDFGDCTVLTGSAVPSYMEETFNPFRTPAGRLVPRGPKVSTWHEEMATVAAGQAVTGVAAEAGQFYPWPNIVYLPIRDAPPCQWALVWRTAAETPLIQSLVQAAHDARTRAANS
ncbi:LysR family transcriptional regulator [Frankia sp. AiPs1]|uniref:LysR substrate-binding domain-containing protein n=1 Tax=Frankia sp. AiPa1 TaxID=573492 RepID=UPI00202B1FB4|nr:LysR substrate-binding domain-containing protein [Frankia sp. AiPa1]MCL9758560.1 LysR substrate-binding domain-containing protein [Frankia sp. AiPa1]